MKGIYLLAMTAVVAMCLIPAVAEDSDANNGYLSEFWVGDRLVAVCYSDELIKYADAIPEEFYLREGYDFLGWSLDPAATKPSDLTLLNGQERSMTLYAIYKELPSEPEFDWTPVISAAIILGLIASVLAVWYATKR